MRIPGFAQTAPPSPLGYWIAYLQSPDFGVPLAQLAECHAEWVAPRLGQNGWNEPFLKPEHLAALKNAGYKVYPWVYVTPGGMAGAVKALGIAQQTGACDGFILDAEAEFVNQGQAALALARGARATLGDSAWIAHAPFDQVEMHPDFPYREFAAGGLNAVMPQLYAYEHNDAGVDYWLAKYDAQWSDWEAKNPDYVLPRYPVGTTYRPKVRGGQNLGGFDPAKLADDLASHAHLMTGGQYTLEMLYAGPPEVRTAFQSWGFKRGIWDRTVSVGKGMLGFAALAGAAYKFWPR